MGAVFYEIKNDISSIQMQKEGSMFIAAMAFAVKCTAKTLTCKRVKMLLVAENLQTLAWTWIKAARMIRVLGQKKHKKSCLKI